MVRRAGADAAGSPLSILAGQREVVGLWMLQRLPDVTELPGGYEAIGVVRDGMIVGGCLYTNYRPLAAGGADIHLWAVGQAWLSRRTIGVMLGYPLKQLRCSRVTATTEKGNRPARRLLDRLGFRLEGVIREGAGPKKDVCLYGLLRDECRWCLV